MAQYTVRAEKSRERLKAEDEKKGRHITEVVTATTLDEVIEGVPKFRRGKKTSRKRGERE